MSSNIVFKGSKNGLQLIIDDNVDFDSVLEQLKLKLASASEFFTNGSAQIQVPAANSRFTPEQQTELITLFSHYGLTWLKDNNTGHQEGPVFDESQAVDEQDHPLIISKTVRNGQEIVHQGTIVVQGDINPGAKVIAGGDILVHGTCRGVAHAGAFGNMNATITADRLLATQIRIAGLIARAPDNLDIPECVETARIVDGAVIIEPA
ncbi:Septum site-determining protein MinC [bioreactor metagenome]|uniref:Septum site-determining protein MinC n=1 Tax=bioreactor metagenome TaxID=1076179 RepID=A0A644T8Y4_9ZZZZ|nr:septum site-determining protein MinC [Negativicutes bacterium]